MKKLTDIWTGVIVQQSIGDTNIVIRSIHFDSRKVESESLFVAIKGTQTDGHHFIDSGY